jgi:AraC-like DNA-binding protein
MITFLEGYPRETEGPRLYLMGWRPGLEGQVDHRFARWAAMFVFRGDGLLDHAGRSERLEAPFLLLARAGKRYRYGPDETWDECHMVFDTPPDGLRLSEWPRGALPMQDPTAVRAHLNRALRLLENPAVAGVVDQLDALAPVMMLAARYGSGERVGREPLRRIYAAEQWMREHLGEGFEVADVSERFGFSPATFRRWWNRRFELSPWQYVIRLRMQEAQRLLLASRYLSVGQVARRVGYPDPRYFATAFRQATGMTPTEFREQATAD